MVVNKRKKVGKYRGHTTHGGGHRKKRRGAGSRGGRGNAGTGKRASHKIAGRISKLGAKGFTSKKAKSVFKTVNVGWFTNERLNKLVNEGKAVKEGDCFNLDLSKLKYDKLLGTGKISLKIKVMVSQCSKLAAEKIKVAGGEVVSLTKNSSEETKEVSKESSEDSSKDSSE